MNIGVPRQSFLSRGSEEGSSESGFCESEKKKEGLGQETHRLSMLWQENWSPSEPPVASVLNAVKKGEKLSRSGPRYSERGKPYGL